MNADTATPLSWTARRRLIGAWLRDRGQFARKILPRTCPVCGHHGMFISVGKPARWDARCLNCGCRERHRLTWLWMTEGGGNKLDGKRILHFAPEKVWMNQMRGNPLYETAGLQHVADVTLDHEARQFVDLPRRRVERDFVVNRHC